MLLALGIYPLFIAAIADVTTLKLKLASIAVLGSVVVAAAMAILLLAGPVKQLVVDHRWIMYSLFIGLTLGGVPVVWRLARPAVAATWIGVAGGFVGMAVLAVSQQAGSDGGAGGSGFIMLFFAGLAGAGAMILPGVSGGYVLLVLGQYVPILGAVDRFKDALGAQDLVAAIDVGLKVLTPVGLGVVIGIVAISNLLKFLLQRYEKVTLGVLLGLLIGAVVGLWPFQEGVAPEIGSLHKGQEVTELTRSEIDEEDYPTRFFTPTPGQVGGAIGLVLAGFLLTSLLARLDPERRR
jgi:putative membrane protein